MTGMSKSPVMRRATSIPSWSPLILMSTRERSGMSLPIMPKASSPEDAMPVTV